MNRFVLMFAVSWIFLPSKYRDTEPVKPYVEALPDPRESVEVRSWRRTQVWDRNGGWYRVERVNPRSYRPSSGYRHR